MAYDPLNPNGQATMANSQPVVLSSNQSPVSVAGTVNVGTMPSVYGNISGSVIAIVNNIPSISGTVGASIIGLPPFRLGDSSNASVITVGTPVANQSVSGIVGASIIGLPTFQIGNNSVIAVQQGSVATVIIGGSIAASFTPPANQSVSGTVGASIIGAPPVTQGGTWIASVFGNMSVIGTVPVTQSGPWSTSIVGTIPGSIVAFQGGTQITSIVSAIPSSVLVGSSIFGQLPAGTAMLGSVIAYQGVIPWTISSIYGNISGSVVAFQGTSPWVVNFQNSSVLAVPVGSVITVQQSPSIVGTYAEDAGHTSADKGVFTLAVRNDTIASTASADLDYAIHAVDSAGRTITKPFASEDATIISYVGSVVSGSVTLIQASAVGKRSYITDYWLSNTGATTTLVTFQDGSTSIIGYAVAPTGGGSNSPGINIPLKTAPSQDLAFKMATATSVLYLTVKGYQAP